MRHEHQAVANAENWDSQRKDLGIDPGRVLVIDAGRASGKNDPVRLDTCHLSGGDAEGDDLRINLQLADATGDDLRVLGPEIQDEDFGVLGWDNRLQELRMGLRNSVLVCLVARWTIHRPELTLTCDAAFELALDFLCAPLFDRIGTTAHHQCVCDREQDRQGLHLLILGSDQAIASEGSWAVSAEAPWARHVYRGF